MHRATPQAGTRLMGWQVFTLSIALLWVAGAAAPRWEVLLSDFAGLAPG